MYSVVFELEEMKKHDTMFWLPARGRDNGVPAENWVMIAELEADDVVPILEMLTDADVGGYVAPPCGERARASGCHLLYVDTMRYHRAEDALMHFMRGKRRRSEVVEPVPRVVVRESIWLLLWTALRGRPAEATP
jgi:hypothetical protein